MNGDDTTTFRVPLSDVLPPELTTAGAAGVDDTAQLAPGQAPAPAELAATRPDGPRYELVAEVGQGGMGRVVQAQDRQLLREVALKVLRSPDGEAKDRFVHEAQLTSQLDHPNVLPVYDLDTDAEGNPYFTMKLIQGHETLADVIEGLRAGELDAYQRFSFRRRVEVVQRVCQALAYAHRRGVIHRDLKPSNIVLGRFGEVYLVDWGIAKPIGQREEAVRTRRSGSGSDTGPAGDDGSSDPENPYLTDPDTIVGTPAYMAPEQVLDGDQLDQRADLYSLAAVLYELLCLHHPLGDEVRGMRHAAVLEGVLNGVPRPAETYVHPQNGRVPRSLSQVCEKGLAKDPGQRFQTAAELEEALQRWVEGLSPIVCGGTCMQSLLHRWVRLIDRYPFVVPTISLVLGVLFLRWLLVSIWELARTLWVLVGSG